MEKKVTLYSIKSDDGDWFFLRAFMFPDGKLSLEGQDFSQLALKIFGNEEHEYYYTFDVSNTNKLIKVFETDNLLESLVNFFNGEMLNKEFDEFCQKNDIKYDIHLP